MDDIEDDISELPSIAPHPSSPGNISQNLPELENASDIPDIDIGCDQSQVSLSRSVSLVPTGASQPKQKQWTPRSWVWGTPEEPLGVLVEVRGIK